MIDYREQRNGYCAEPLPVGNQCTRLIRILAWGTFLSRGGILPDWMNPHSILESPHHGRTANGALPGAKSTVGQRDLI